MKTEWKWITEFQGLYKINKEGVIVSYHHPEKPKILKAYLDRYLFVRLVKNKKYYNRKIHRLLAQEFIPNPKKYKEINHIDGNKTNNSLSNLEWCTHEQNMRHAEDNGLIIHAKGESHGRAKLNSMQVLEIRKLAKNGSRTNDLAKKYGVTKDTIGRIKYMKAWKHI